MVDNKETDILKDYDYWFVDEEHKAGENANRQGDINFIKEVNNHVHVISIAVLLLKNFSYSEVD